ncbi:hypothetical protein AUR64_06995 [Haloprofundus marisrubri]|uniref:Fenitrothion hydrolase n=1 Tax=Haloprofundus marisrubri TaxID=1514971 RepID=A0A0W1RCT6_9EURY|nr:hypothetical protein AUR64_06995 [Haloprofundus marisrubri]
MVVIAVVATCSESALAHAGSLSGSLRPVSVPLWLVVVSGGGVVGVSFLFTTLVTDHEAIRSLNGRRIRVPSIADARAVVLPAVRWLSVAALVGVVVMGFVGPAEPLRNLAVLVVWVGWWPGYTISTYLVVNSWPVVNPWRTLSTSLSVGRRPLPARLGRWVSVVGLLFLVWLEVVSPVSENPRWLATVVVGYSVVTIAGAAVYGDAWFARVDPVSRVFHLYGRLAPVQRTADGYGLSFPGAALARQPTPMTEDDVAFVVALLWVTTYDGLVSTAPWNDVVRAASRVGVPPLLVHLITVFVGFALLFGAYRLSARLARRTAETYVTPGFIGRWFAPSLLPIAAGYHLAHFLGFFLGLAPTLVVVGFDPLAPPYELPTLVLPAWFGTLQLVFVVAGHLLAVWVAHARAFGLFPGRLQPIRSQYPLVVVAICYTTSSLWIVAQPFAAPLT